MTPCVVDLTRQTVQPTSTAMSMPAKRCDTAGNTCIKVARQAELRGDNVGDIHATSINYVHVPGRCSLR